jgi:hypothetical protein
VNGAVTEWFDTLRPVLAGVGGALGVWALSRFTLRAKPDQRGWRSLKPGAMHWTGLTLSSGLVALFLYVRVFVGSSRTDAASQMAILNLLIVGFGIGMAVTAWQMRQMVRTDAHWRGSKLKWRDPTGAEQVRSLDQVSGMRRNPFGRIAITFSDGAVVRVDPYATGAAELCDRIIAIDEELGAA